MLGNIPRVNGRGRRLALLVGLSKACVFLGGPQCDSLIAVYLPAINSPTKVPASTEKKYPTL